MDQVFFKHDVVPAIPAHRRVYTAGLLLHIAALAAVVVLMRPHPVRVTPGPVSQMGIAAFNAGAIGTSGESPTPAAKPAAPKKPAPTRASATMANANPEPAASDDAGGSGAQGGGGGTGPVRLGSGEGLTLLTKITPVYPRTMEAARIPGVVVLEAIIHRDGTIGNVTVTRSTNDAFAHAAIEAVKRWRYTPLPYEGLVTVTVNFTVPR